VELQDQFDAFEATVKDTEFFCNPAAKLHGNVTTPILNPNHHLTFYTIECKEEPQTWQVEVDNQFGPQNLTVSGPVGLGVPTQKEGHEPPVGLDHFLLYEVTTVASMEVVVGLNDQFGNATVMVYEPVYFANPVQKTYESVLAEIENPEEHLVFYEIVDFNTALVVSNQFANDDCLNVAGPHLLAVPSEKISFVGPCFIATAAYGTSMAEEIEILREFRDEYLLTNPVGRDLVEFYYRVSPPMAEFITEHPSLKPIVRAGLVPAVTMSAVAVNTTPAEKAAIAGLVVLVSVALAVWVTKRRGRGPRYT